MQANKCVNAERQRQIDEDIAWARRRIREGRDQ
jgi:hypothetical protein